MKTSAAILALAGVIATKIQGTAAECYRSGDSWPPSGGKEEAVKFVREACRDQGGAFTGFYQSGETKRICKTATLYPYILEGFEVQNLNTREGFDLNDNDCLERLSNEIQGCGMGGQSEVAGWRFKADPGNC